MLPPHLQNQYAPDTVDTTSATPKVGLVVDVPLNSIVEIAFTLRARRRATFGVALFKRVYRVQNNAGTLTLLQEIAPIPDQNAPGYGVSCAVNSSTDRASVSVTGASGHNVEWQFLDVFVIA